jgi:predicted nucleic acid-binding protein
MSHFDAGEIEKGILRKEEGKRRRDLQRWFGEDLPTRLRGAFLLSMRGSRHAGSSERINAREGRPLPTIDSQLAATALAHDLVLVTLNVKDFEGTGITALNKWERT